VGIHFQKLGDFAGHTRSSPIGETKKKIDPRERCRPVSMSRRFMNAPVSTVLCSDQNVSLRCPPLFFLLAYLVTSSDAFLIPQTWYTMRMRWYELGMVNV
jgi:hypothetical protein